MRKLVTFAINTWARVTSTTSSMVAVIEINQKKTECLSMFTESVTRSFIIIQ